MQNNCIIYDIDEPYGKRLMCAISQKKNLPFRVQLFTQQEELQSYLDKNTADIMVVSEACCSYGLDKKCSKKTLILTEQEGRLSDEIVQRFEVVKGVYKYQSADYILREMIHFAGKEEQQKAEAELIGVYSPVYEPLRSYFALSLAQVFAESTKTLYCNLEEFSGLQELLSAKEGESLSDMMYYYRQSGGKVTQRIKQIICTVSGVDYIPPVQWAQDIGCMETEQIAELVLGLAGACGYTKVVLDISSAVREQWKLIFQCSRVYMPVKEDYLSQQKVQEFEKYLLLSGMEHLWNRIERINVPQKGIEGNPLYFGSKEGEEMNEFVRNVLAG